MYGQECVCGVGMFLALALPAVPDRRSLQTSKCRSRLRAGMCEMQAVKHTVSRDRMTCSHPIMFAAFESCKAQLCSHVFAIQEFLRTRSLRRPRERNLQCKRSWSSDESLRA